MKNKRLRKLPAVLGVIAGTAALIYGFWPVPMEVDLERADTGSLLVTVDEDGKTRIREKYKVSAPVSGKLLRLELEPGDEVRQGKTVLAMIEPADPGLLDARQIAEAEARVRASDAARLQNEAALVRAQQAYALTQDDYQRALTLIQRGATPQAEFDRIEHQERIAQADVRAAEFAQKVATFEHELAKAALISTQGDAANPPAPLTILSPVNGRVLRVFEENSNVVSPGNPLLEVGDPRDLEMVIDVLSSDAVRIQSGDRVIIEHWGGPAALQGSVRLVEPSAFLKVSALGVEEQRVNVIADFLDPLDKRAALGDGYRIEARIVVDEANEVLVVPAGALFRQAERWCVFRVDEGRARLQVLRIGKSNGLTTEILEGLAAGDRVILHPSDKIREGLRVRPLGAAAAPAS